MLTARYLMSFSYIYLPRCFYKCVNVDGNHVFGASRLVFVIHAAHHQHN